MTKFLGLLYDVAMDNIFEFLVMLIICGFILYVLWMGVKSLFTDEDKK